MRVFISIEIPEQIKEEIKRIQDKLPEFRGKKTETENLHLTLKFLGEVGEEKIEKVKEKLGRIKSNKFETEIDSIGVFSPNFIKIVWLHLTNCDELQREIDNVLENLFLREKRFMSHLTIVRVKSLKDKEDFLKQIRKIESPKIKFVVDSFKLKKSALTEKGPTYETLEKYNLI